MSWLSEAQTLEGSKALFTETIAANRGKPLSWTVVGLVIRFLDGAAISLLGVAVYFSYVRPIGSSIDGRYVGAIASGAILAVLMLSWSGVYKKDVLFAKRVAAGRVLLGWAVAFSLLLAFAFALKISASYSRVWAGTWFLSGGVLLLCLHALVRSRLRTLARSGRFAARSVIVGAGEQGQRLADHLRQHGDTNTRLIGFVDDRLQRVPGEVMGLPVLGNVSELKSMIWRGLVDQVFIALPWTAENRLTNLAHDLAITPLPIRLVPDLAGFRFANRSYEQVAGLPLLKLHDRPLSGWSIVLKEIEDRTLAALALLSILPLLAAIAAAIKLDSKGPVLFKQSRVGFNNQLIEIWKFRTMYTELTDPDCVSQTLRKDPRVTRVGAFLRRSSLDELPQLINVLRGDMSLVGPRPHALQTKAAGRYFEDIVDRYAARHRVKPGITGWAQVHGWRGETDTVEKVKKRCEYDIYYIDNWSLWLDLVILFRTLIVIWNDKNAY